MTRLAGETVGNVFFVYVVSQDILFRALFQAGAGLYQSRFGERAAVLRPVTVAALTK